MKEKIMKASRSLKPICLFFAVVLLSSCTHTYYAPNTHIVPMFEHKGELIVTGAIGASNSLHYIDYDNYLDYIETVEFQSAYALTDNIGIIANGYFAYSEAGGEYGKGFIFEAGAGYFKSLNHLFVFETYGGFGYGNVENRYGVRIDSYNRDASNLNFVRYFAQPSIGLTTRYFDLAISTKFSGLNYSGISYPKSTNTMPYEDEADLKYIERNPFSLLFEPAATIRLGYKNVKLQYQFGMSFNLTNPDFPQENMMMSLGICLILGKDYKE